MNDRSVNTLDIGSTLTVGELRKFIEDVPDSAKIELSNDLEGIIQIDLSDDKLIIDVW